MLSRKVNSLLVLLLMMIGSTQLVPARYVPQSRPSSSLYQRGSDLNDMMPPQAMSRRQDMDDDDGDELDSNASAPYQNQNEAGGNNDGYEDAEADGPYEETPREQEGQADLERFFDDHLGASDRDGMDKENLPSNVLPIIVMPMKKSLGGDGGPAVPNGQSNVNKLHHHNQRHQLSALPTIHTEFIRLPDEKLIITRQVTQDTSRLGSHHHAPEQQKPYRRIPAPVIVNSNNNNGGSSYNNSDHSINSDDHRRPLRRSSIEFNDEVPDAQDNGRAAQQLMNSAIQLNGVPDDHDKSSAPARDVVVVAEDDDFKRVYVTNSTNKPFRIEQLGGFDPEEAFNDASREMNEVKKTDSPSTNRPRRHNSSNKDDEDDDDGDKQLVAAAAAASPADLNMDTLWEDASETDEITFGQDDPYQTDLEAEMRHQAFDKIGIFNANNIIDGNNNKPDSAINLVSQPKETTTNKKAVKDNDNDNDLDDDDESGKQQQQQPNYGMVMARQPLGIHEQLRRRNDDDDNNASIDSGSNLNNNNSPSTKKEVDADDEGEWAHDGVEDMEIPSQARQNQVLAKAAKQEELARRAAEEEEARNNETPSGDPEDQQEEEDNQRMPNADYMKADLREPDESYRS